MSLSTTEQSATTERVQQIIDERLLIDGRIESRIFGQDGKLVEIQRHMPHDARAVSHRGFWHVRQVIH